MEIWKEIKGFEALYEVSNLGNVKRLKGYQAQKERHLSKINNKKDYLFVNLSKHGIKKAYYIHRLVASAFLENKKNKEEVNHINGIRGDNRLDNLEWTTRSENHFHRYNVLKQKGVNFGKTGAANWKSKKVHQLDLNGNFLKSYPAVMEAMRKTNINEASIRGCICGKQKTAGGYKWKYA
jgi:hypothetical protein